MTVFVTATVIAIGNLVLVIAVTYLTVGAAVDTRGSNRRVDWRKARVMVRRTRRMCCWGLRRPWRSAWNLVGFWKRQMHSAGLVKMRHVRACEWRAVYASMMSRVRCELLECKDCGRSDGRRIIFIKVCEVERRRLFKK